MKKVIISFLCLSSLSLTGCLEEILASICKELASNNTITASLENPSVNQLSNVAVVTYTNTTNPDTYVRSECDGDFTLPLGERSESSSLSFLSVLDDEGNAFFFDINGNQKSDTFSTRIDLYTDCAAVVANMPNSFHTSSVQPNWQENPLEIEQCEITGQTTVILVPNI